MLFNLPSLDLRVLGAVFTPALFSLDELNPGGVFQLVHSKKKGKSRKQAAFKAVIHFNHVLCLLYYLATCIMDLRTC